jgi:transcription initiation factor IIF auxiliary subunit
MNLQISQGFEYQGDDRWRWWIWIEGPDAALDRIDRVIYTLHPTFPNPVRTVTDRASRFQLKTSGWGVFKIHAKLHYKDGSTESLSHHLELHYPDGTATTA